uniref:Glycosyltransferase n=1 Tax=Aloe vera TaxID=34199 RepID=A0A2P0QDF6_ALOVR|nr:glycosyltransferase 5 [Aloe vera]
MGSDMQPQPLKMIFFPFMAQGHILPMVDMANLFASRGVQAAIFTTPGNASVIQPSISDTQVQLLIVPFPSHPQIPPGCENASSLPSLEMRQAFFLAIADLREPFRQTVQEFRPDCIVTDMFLPWTVDVAADLNIPRLVFHGTNVFSRCCIDSFDRHNLAVQENPEDQLVIHPGLPHEIKLLRSQLDSSRTSHPSRAALFKAMRESESRSYGVVVNSFYEVEPDYADHYRSVLGKKSWHVGPVSLCNTDAFERGNKAAIDQENLVSWLETKASRSVVYVCFGSMVNFPAEQIRELALGLEASGHSFVWVVRNHQIEGIVPEEFEERTRGRGLIIKGWAPQILILNHRSVGCFVTHCGWNSSLEGITAGVPLVTWPLFAEQFYNEKLIVDVLKIGVGVGVEKYGIVAEEREVIEAARVERAVREVLGGGEEAEERRRRARELGKAARRAVEEGGSSYVDVSNLMQELIERRSSI